MVSTSIALLKPIAQRAMVARGLEPEFSAAAVAESNAITGQTSIGSGSRDMRQELWCSIDNDDSRDLDQLTAARALANGVTRILVAVADVASTVPRGGAIDLHASRNTTSVYTAAGVFPMLPLRLSTDLTSLNEGVDRLALVAGFDVGPDGSVSNPEICSALVHNRAKLAYHGVDAWMDGRAAAPTALARVPGLEENLRRQDAAARSLRARRHEAGALSLETVKSEPVIQGDTLVDLAGDQTDDAKLLIQDLMIAANQVTARFLAARQYPSIRRVVREPAQWPRIVEIAAAQGTKLPAAPDAVALEHFLVQARTAAPAQFADLSLTIIKLIGRGEYVLGRAGGPAVGSAAAGHFGLAVRDYAHSTAPNRRYPDLITQRLLRGAIAGGKAPYSEAELDALAKHCTEAEDAAHKVERQVQKSAASLLLSGRVGENFDGIVTGASANGTWVRVAHPLVEGKVVGGSGGLAVGQRVRVRLVRTDVELGRIDFVV